MSNEKPILFSGPMVRAILEGRKTQTRRVVKFASNAAGHNQDGCNTVRGNKIMRVPWTPDTLRATIKCPYPVGTRLWVRETWAVPHQFDSVNPAAIPHDARVHYMADLEGGTGLIKRPSIHMPRWASRITLEVTDVRVQRLQDIDRSDCIAEGVLSWDGCRENRFPEENFKALWESIHGPGAWDANPWVWAYTFKVVTP